jgi:hypothetical protein
MLLVGKDGSEERERMYLLNPAAEGRISTKADPRVDAVTSSSKDHHSAFGVALAGETEIFHRCGSPVCGRPVPQYGSHGLRRRRMLRRDLRTRHVHCDQLRRLPGGPRAGQAT